MPAVEAPDHELIRAVAAGDRDAFDALVRRHGGAMQRVARAVTGDETLAQDATQDALLQAFRAASSYRPERGPLRPWLLAVARNAAHRQTRNSQRLEPGVSDADEPLLALGRAAGWGEPPDERFARAEHAAQWAWAFASLAPADREVLLLRDVEQLSTEEAATILEVNARALKSRLHRARLRLMAAMRGKEQAMRDEEREVAGIRCGAVLARLSDYVDGELGDEERPRIDAHLLGCTVCERFGGHFARAVNASRVRLGAAPAVDATVADKVRRLLIS